MEALSDGTDFQDFFELDNLNEPSGDVEMQEDDENAHDTTDDALETILMAENESAMEKKIVPTVGSVASRILPSQKNVVNIPQTKVVMASQPIQVLTQEKPGTVVTKYILKKPLQSATSISSGTFTMAAPTRNKATAGIAGLQTLTIPVQKNSLTLSPAKGGFKIPPLKNPLKVSMLPSNSHAVRTINLSTSVDINQPADQPNPNFQFQTLVTQQSKPVNISNTQIITQNINNQPQIPGTRLQCVRLVPAGNSQNSTSTGIPVANLLAAPGNTNTLSVGTTIVPQPRLQHILNVQALQKPAQQQLKAQRLIMPATTVQAPQPAVTNLSPGSLLQAGNVGYAMVPAKYVEQLKKQLNSQLYNTEQSSSMPAEPSHTVAPVTKVAVNGKVRKPCNCTKSMCLKLYCECFANGHFCDGCNCVNCHNNLEFDGDRSKAIKSCLERNPMAFRPKIGRGRDDNRTHQKGCNCKRSGCLKNYCECYEARILCTSRCKCIGCKNIEEDGGMNSEHHPLMNLADAADVRRQQQAAARKRINSHLHQIRPLRPKAQSSYTSPGEKLPCTFFTQEVIEATCTCMLAQAEEAEKTNRSIQVAEMMVLEEFGKCLMQIIQAAGKAKSNSNP